MRDTERVVCGVMRLPLRSYASHEAGLNCGWPLMYEKLSDRKLAIELVNLQDIDFFIVRSSQQRAASELIVPTLLRS